MSHYRPTIPLARLLAFAITALAINCARLGEAAVVFSEQNILPAQPVVATVIKPGMGTSGGPIAWDFWVKSRTAASDAALGSFAPFSKLNATRIAVSANFVLYRDSTSGTMTSGQAATVLATMETAYANLKNIYGAGEHPYTNDGARIVILAYNIQDDYSTTGNYVGGFFSPRDLYSNDFTQKLYTDPVAVQQYSSFIGQLGGYSNEMSIIHYDLNPGYSGNPSQVNDIVIHELSHLFTYSKRVVKQRLVNHDLWIAEGIAENAPHQTISTANVEALRLTQLASPSVITYYQDAPQLTDFVTWAPKIVGYLQSNLFFNYLRHRAEAQVLGSAATMLTELMTQEDQTIAGVDALIQKYITGANFASLYGDFVMTHYLMLLGIEIADSNGINGAGGPGLKQKYSFCNVEIGISDTAKNNCASIKARYPAVVPYNFEAPKCADGTYGLKPNSYTIFRHKITGDKVLTDTAGSNPVAGELPLKYVFNTTTEATLLSSPPATTTLRTYDANQTIPFLTGGFGYAANDIVHIIVYNPNKTGSCRALDNTMVLKRNHSKWIGSNSFGTQPTPDFEWQTGTGAAWANNSNGMYYRPGAITAAVSSYPNNFLYVLDYNNMSLQKLNMDTGAALGRVGSTTATCPTTGSGWDVAINRYLNGYCAHHFDAPQGVHSDIVAARNGTTTSGANSVTGLSATADLTVGLCVNGANVPVGTKIASIVNGSSITVSQNATVTGTTSLSFGCLYVADSNNRRLVQYDSAGNFVAWLGNYGAGNDVWQDASTVTDAVTLYNNGSIDNPKMFFVPWAITSDSTYLYVVDYGARRIQRRNKSTGAFVDFAGNGYNGWSTTNPIPANNFGSSAGYLREPRGIVITGGNLYVADELNNRVVRINSSGVWTGWIGNGVDGWQAVFPASGTSGSSAAKDFSAPAAIATDGTYLYVADRANNRISRWNIATGNFSGWIGHGRIGWEMTAAAPATDPYAGVSFYPPDYYAEPHGVAVVTQAQKGTRNDYLYVTSVYNGRVTRINLSCVNNPGGTGCDPIYTFP